MTVDDFIIRLEVELGCVFTSEQRDFMKNLDTPGMCFASPGTGKTHSAVAGLIITELMKQIPGENIYALSFTNMATLELSLRHEKACKKIGIRQRVNFKTLHKLCSSILKEHAHLLGMERMETTSSFPVSTLANMVIDLCRERNIDLNPYKVRNVIRAVRILNSSLTFERENVTSKACFLDTGLSYDDFMQIRKALYDYNKLVERIQVDDILLYTLELLLRHPEVSEEYKKKCRVLLVDEAQDLSLLQLRIITLLSDCPVLIGDIKQQIYAFNGACQEIVGQYYKYHPEGWKKYLNQSFRCKNEIADYSTKVILPNKVGGEDFKGVGGGGAVSVSRGMDYAEICESIADEYFKNSRNFKKGVLFLFRNNASAIPLAEEFYKLSVPFRVNHYVKASALPVITDLCEIAELASTPNSVDNLEILKKLVPEFREYESVRDMPFHRIMQKKRCSLFDISYKFKDEYCGERVMEMLLRVHDMLNEGRMVVQVFNTMYPLYYEYWMKAREMFLEYDASYYMKLANAAMKNKTYSQFRKDEISKEKFIDECNNKREGVRCYTFHAAKGLEDDIVYLVDCDHTIVPNQRKFEDMAKKGCNLDIAREIRNERSLVYVACTRAKEELHIFYNDELSTVFNGGLEYNKYDMMYEEFHPNYKDVEVFQTFYTEERWGCY